VHDYDRAVAGYTIVNLLEIEDQAPKFGLTGLEARFARGPLEADALGLSLQRFAPRFRTPFGHRHEAQEEIYILLSGTGLLKLDDEVRDLRQWDCVRIASETMRCFEAGPEGAELLVVGGPVLGANDAEMVPGWWSD
jgi:mannose-6-phosphate isomerase-like protein (cupin superfamily)